MSAGPKSSLESCWITWEVHRRSRSLARELGIPLVELSRPGGRMVRYTRNSVATLRHLTRHRYRTVFVQAPSVVLAVMALVMGAIFRFRVVVDAHNAIIEGAERAPLSLRILYRFVVRTAHRVIVTNSSLADRVHALGGRPGVLPDPVPDIQPGTLQSSSNKAVVISTWAADEPLEAVLGAARYLPQPLVFTITGRPRGPLAQLARSTGRVELSGFVSEPDYVTLLSGAKVIVDLTTREDCLVCGAYEALALGRPLVVSDSRALRELLRDGAVFAKNEPEDIARAVAEASGDESRWSAQCAARRESYVVEWQIAAAELLGALDAA
jgi:glycosyltransferase involved in cell wall biosynthesis